MRKAVPNLDPDAALGAVLEEVAPVEVDRILDGLCRVVADALELSPRHRRRRRQRRRRRRLKRRVRNVGQLRQQVPDVDRQVLVGHLQVELLQGHLELVG